MKVKALSIVLSIAIANSAFAANTKAAPEVCPNLTAIKAAGVNHGVQENGGWLVLGPKSQFNTKQEWQFAVILRTNFETEQQAIAVGRQSLTKIAAMVEGPVQEEKDLWVCVYSDAAQKNFGVAITPPYDAKFAQVVAAR
jgi:hypothetical protein